MNLALSWLRRNWSLTCDLRFGGGSVESESRGHVSSGSLYTHRCSHRVNTPCDLHCALLSLVLTSPFSTAATLDKGEKSVSTTQQQMMRAVRNERNVMAMLCNTKPKSGKSILLWFHPHLTYIGGIRVFNYWSYMIRHLWLITMIDWPPKVTRNVCMLGVITYNVITWTSSLRAQVSVNAQCIVCYGSADSSMVAFIVLCLMRNLALYLLELRLLFLSDSKLIWKSLSNYQNRDTYL